MSPAEGFTAIRALCDDIDQGTHDRMVSTRLVREILDGIELVPTLSPGWGITMPWKLRTAYAWRCLRGDVRITSLVDVSKMPTAGYMEGVIRVRTGKPWRGEK